MLDYLIVGGGLAGMAVAETLEARNLTYQVCDQGTAGASRVAAGLYNPVVLKRFNLTWKGGELMDFSLPFYRRLQQKLGVEADHPLPLLRLLHSPAEQNDWFEAADRPELAPFLKAEILPNTNPAIEAPHGFGPVTGAGWLDTSLLLDAWLTRLASQGKHLEGRFDHAGLSRSGPHWQYAGLRARNVVFCEGFGMRANPYFNELPLQGTKGEYLTIHAPDLAELQILKASVFLIPLGADRYRVGATYAWKDFETTPTQAAREKLLSSLQTFLKSPFRIIDQTAGIRPTVPDRRPLVGRHPELQGLYLLNGMGSRGVLLAPFAADRLVALSEEGEALPDAMDLARFTKKNNSRRS